MGCSKVDRGLFIPSSANYFSFLDSHFRGNDVCKDCFVRHFRESGDLYLEVCS